MEKLLDTTFKKTIFYVLVSLVVIAIGYFIFFRKNDTQSTKPITTQVLKPINSFNDPNGIKDGKYRDVPNSQLFGSNPNNNNWNISIKFNLENFYNTLQCIVGNMQDNNSVNNWGLWITPQRKLQWRLGSNSSWDLDNFGLLQDNTLYEISITYNGNYSFSLKNLSSSNLAENFNVIEPQPIVINAPPLNTSNGSVTFGGEFPKANMNSKFLGSISGITSSEVTVIAITPSSINTTPSSINTTPSSINTTPSTTNTTPSTLSTTNTTPSTTNTTPSSINTTPSTTNTTPSTTNTTTNTTPSTTNTTPSTTNTTPSTTNTTPLYQFVNHTFTTANKTGNEGPTLTEVINAYPNIDWVKNSEFLNMTTQGIQEWKVPANGSYMIRAVGAAGGNPGTYNKGMDVYLTTTLIKGEVIKILVGQKGIKTTSKNGSGGGGTFVVRGTETAIIVAGGGGGRSRQGEYNNLNSNANASSNGNKGGDGSATDGKGGSDGNGGSQGSFTSGGGGFITNGVSASFVSGGKSFKNGGNGGIVTNPNYIIHGSVGGFGGGGSVVDDGGGGGGGYSGGGGGDYNGSTATKNGGGGGGSYGISNLIVNGAINNGDGLVVITANF